MRSIPLIASLGLAMALLATPIAQASERFGPHPVRGWNGNQFLFEVQPQNDIIYLVGYRAIGRQWEMVGSTTIHRGQRTPERGFLQEIWFHGRHLGYLEADMSDPWWRWYPRQERPD
jgi:hypothetical protein